jgi:hypothetical protein
MVMEVGFAAFIDEPPVIEINGSIVRINYRRLDERVMSVRTLRRSVERGKRISSSTSNRLTLPHPAELQPAVRAVQLPGPGL